VYWITRATSAQPLACSRTAFADQRDAQRPLNTQQDSSSRGEFPQRLSIFSTGQPSTLRFLREAIDVAWYSPCG
jgi:hypothetical protein